MDENQDFYTRDVFGILILSHEMLSTPDAKPLERMIVENLNT